MKPYRLTPAATKDLSEIWDYTEERWDADQAESYVREIGAAIERVAEDSLRGRDCGDIRPGYRRYGIGSHTVYYVDRPDTINVIRILHQRMDPSRHL
ncbi:type II toxin-antitoxin system RelE/ParE family toxin [Clavibacter zhangzhiyongii]|uniref:Toxin n=1 Tax=Clavibacter zhangzhiyongii TaxID=2768071 RepID=A0A7L7Z1C9_9MICO|nr:type II toxin-antitoxin system RelE/ParE family toxin [Clavibacter zhangzhiyongii]QOD43544.1 type II toxin-antitoxin system RelE/ParE family toxin [Clavibacter zhangzhiyongii]